MNVPALALLGLILTAGAPGAGEHLLAGARLFRDGHYAEALVEFRVAERLGDPDARGYAAASLLKLDRPEQAVETFESPGAPPPGRDALLDHYHALACYEAKLYVRADRLLERVGPRVGPRIAEQAAKMRTDIAALLASAPSAVAVDWYLARCEEQATGGHRVLARAYCEEARALAERRPDHHGLEAARSRLERLQERAEAR